MSIVNHSKQDLSLSTLIFEDETKLHVNTAYEETPLSSKGDAKEATN